ncbi:MAG: multi-sensor signal transduction histidine kinase [Myxococcaceae bacterium]|nr:multi-sensor signal transduction histidine kinase [Myxococcaceae bacterium]
MSTFRSQGIGLRLVLPTAILTAVLAATVVGLQVRASNRRAAESLDNYAELVGGVVLQGVYDAMLADDRPRLKKQLAQFSASEQVERINIVDKAGRVTFSSDRNSVGEEFSRDSPSCTVCHDNKKPPPTTARTVHYPGADGKMVFRFVQPIVAEQACLECHEEAAVGQSLGILMTDLDEARLIGRQREGAQALSWAVAAAFALLLGSVAVIVRVVVVARLRNVKRAVEFVRTGALATARDQRSIDEIDELERLVQCLGEDLEDRHALDRATRALGEVLERCADPVLLTDLQLRVLAASPTAAGQPLLFSPEPMRALLPQVEADGWTLGTEAGSPLVAAVEDAAHRPLAYAGVWAAPEGEPGKAAAAVRTDVEWQLYTAALFSAIGTEPRRWRGVAQLDRRLASGKRVLAELAAAAAKLRADRTEVDLRSMILLLLWDTGRQVPHVSWHSLVGEQHVVTGARYRLRALVRRLAEAAAAQTGPGGHVVLFTQLKADKSKIYVGAWARSDAAPVPIDGEGKLPLCALLARDHGGGVEVNPGFDLSELCAARGFTLPCDPRGVLFIAELAVDGRQLKPAVGGPR